MALCDQRAEAALRKHRAAQLPAGELVLARDRRHRQVRDEPVIERPVIGEFERAQGMGDALDGVRLAVREIVGRIYAPAVAGAGMRGMEDAVEHGIAKVDVSRGHVDARAQDPRAFGELARAHAPEQVEILLDGAPAPGAFRAGLGQGSARRADLVRGKVVDIGVAVPDQVLGPLVEPLEIVRGVARFAVPFESEPAHVLQYGVDVFLALAQWVGVVEPEVAAPAELRRHAEIDADRLGVADMEMAVGLGRKARDDGAMAARRQILANPLADEVAGRFGGRAVGHVAFPPAAAAGPRPRRRPRAFTTRAWTRRRDRPTSRAGSRGISRPRRACPRRRPPVAC